MSNTFNIPVRSVEAGDESTEKPAPELLDFIAPPSLSHESGVYPDAFELIISHPDADACIYYTTDGSAPDPENIQGSTYSYKRNYAQPPSTESIGKLVSREYKTYRYNEPIKIVDRTYEPDRLSNISTTFYENQHYYPSPERASGVLNGLKFELNKVFIRVNELLNVLVRHFYKYVRGRKDARAGTRIYIKQLELKYTDKNLYKGTPVRALAQDNNGYRSEEISAVFFIGDPGSINLPIINITVPEKDLFDYEVGIFVAGRDYDEYIESGAKEPRTTHDRPANWLRRGSSLRASMFLHDPGNGYSYEDEVGVRVHGGGGRAKVNKSLRLYPNSWLDIFSDNKPSAKNRVILRNGGNGSSAKTYFTDDVIQVAFSHLDFGVQRYKPYVCFLNGEYYGIVNARDRIKRHYFKAMYGLPNSKVDYINDRTVVRDGTDDSWLDFVAKVLESDPESSEFYGFINERISVSSYMDYFAAQIFIVNTDWPGNNYGLWRYRGTKKHPLTADGYTDGRWRWVMFDVDNAGAGGRKYKPDKNMLEFAVSAGVGEWPDHESPSYLFRTFLQNDRLRHEFITRFSDLLNSSFLPERMSAVIRAAEQGIEREMPRHIHRWGEPRSMGAWRRAVDELIVFFQGRPRHQWQHLEAFFHLDGRYSVRVDVAEQNSGRVRVNSLVLGSSLGKQNALTDTALLLPWSGFYFKKLPLILEALPAQGYEFSHWQGDGIEQGQRGSTWLLLEPVADIDLVAVMRKVH